ncbi:MAG: proprotein convertase P-domain-containing protein [Saprospiraceae bacterium]|nr:proprotein convertase P-domain-containing protein [Saprospiraceae bacterium]
MHKLKAALLFLGFLSSLVSYGQDWTSVDPASVSQKLGQRVMPKQYQLLQTHLASMSAALSTGKIDLVMPDGEVASFDVSNSSNFAEGLQRRFPEIRTYLLQSQSHKDITGRLDITPHGMHAVLKHPKGEIYLDPYQEGNDQYFLVYYTRDYRVAPEIMKIYNKHEHHFLQNEAGFIDQKPVRSPFARELEDQVSLRTYRIAICATGEYTSNHNGTVEGTLAAINTALNRINFVMESELAIHLQLIENNDQLIFFDGTSDPFSDGNPSQMALENNNYLVANLGTANYDVGHVFGSTCNSVVGVSGGVGIVCTGMKGFGASCEISTSDRFYIGIVCHELGHQFGAQHTWNNCPPAPDGQFNGSTAFEPGSGSTIMSYAGSCGNQNVAFDSDNYYHSNSIQAIKNYIMTGGNCAEISITENHDPVVSVNLEGGFYIPVSTPFKLTASGSDLDGDTVYYNWEQFDAGVGAASLSPIEDPKGDAPIFRSLPPSTSPTRYLPALNKILSGNFDNSEVLPTYDRKLTFRVTGRDQKEGGGGVSWDEVIFRATQSAGPFQIIDSSIPDTLFAGAYHEFQWDVANTQLFPVNCQVVDIKLSVDGGLTYPYLLSSNTPNDGREYILIPDLVADQARIMVEAADNIFFDINDSILNIQPNLEAGYALDVTPHIQDVCIPSTVSLAINSFPTGSFTDSVYLIDADLPEEVNIISPRSFRPGDPATIELDLSQVTTAMDFEAIFHFTSAVGDTLTRNIGIRTISSDFGDLALRQPLQGASSVSQRPTFIWQGSANADAYRLEVDSSPAFDNPIVSEVSEITSVVLNDLLDENTLYYWRVRPENACGPGIYSTIYAFHTINLSCQQYVATDVPKTLSQSAIVQAQSVLEVANSGEISDVNILSISGSHAAFGDLIFSLISPLGTEVTLVRKQCGFTTKVFDLGFDDEAQDTFNCLTSFNGTVFKPLQPLSKLNGESVEGSWKLQIADSVAGSGGRIDGWTLELCGSLSPEEPTLERLDTFFAQYAGLTTLSDNVLLVSDNVVGSDQLIFTLVTVPLHGAVQLNQMPLNTGSQFSQSDLSAGNLTYTHNGTDSLPDSLIVTVVNGEGAWLGPLTLPIKIVREVVGTKDIQLQGFSTYPNPVNNVLNLENRLNYQGEAEIRIVGMDGSIKLHQRIILDPQISVHVQDLVSGIYAMQVSTQHGVANLKFVKL